MQINTLHFHNEPGDATRYDFYVAETPTFFHILTDNDDLNYPSRINKFHAIPSEEGRNFSQEMLQYSNRLQVNVNTLNQVMLAIEMLGDMSEKKVSF